MILSQTKTGCSYQRPARSGTAALEFALFLPLLVTILLGMIEMSRATMVKVDLSNAARKGCRTGIMMDKGNADITSEVLNIMRDEGYPTAKFNPPTVGAIAITVTDPSGNTLAESLDAPSGSVLSVQVTIPLSSTAWAYRFLSPASLQSETVVMMKQ